MWTEQYNNTISSHDETILLYSCTATQDRARVYSLCSHASDATSKSFGIIIYVYVIIDVHNNINNKYSYKVYEFFFLFFFV